MKRLGIVTIGQSPRPDVAPGMAEILGPGVEIVETGALDAVEDVAALAPRAGETLLVSRLRDGRQVRLARERIALLVQGCIDRLEQEGINPILLLCTASFPGGFRHRGLLLEPDRLIYQLVSGVLGRGRLGVLVPEAEQVGEMSSKWAAPGREVVTAWGSPYGPPAAVAEGARALASQRPELVVLDCVGYRPDHKEIVAAIVRTPVLLSSTILARILAELA